MTPGDCTFCMKLADLPADDMVCEFPHSVAFLGPWQYYRGYCVLVARSHATELSQLDPTVRHAFLDEMCQLARAIEQAFLPNKLNYELLGNQVPHLHWHIFPRAKDDPGALQPVWLAIDRAECDPGERYRLQALGADRAEIREKIREHLKDS
jgi:diadenosine tetraphosphate (Ap4A) HIT family hydrolase